VCPVMKMMGRIMIMMVMVIMVMFIVLFSLLKIHNFVPVVKRHPTYAGAR
jgi:hypothetical protein